MCQGPVETYLPYDGSSGTQIDHVIVHNDHASMVRNVNVHDDHPTNASDHLPIRVVLAVSVPSHDIKTRQLYRWDKADKLCYTYAMEQLLVDSDFINVSINNENVVDELCTCLMDSLKTVSDNTIPKSQYCSYKKPYWNTDLRNMHVEQKRLRRIWICAGRPRGNNHPSYVEYETAKYLFAKSLKSYASEYEQSQFRDISLTKDLNIRQFWKYIRNGRRQRGGLTVINDGNTKYDTPEAQLDMWKTHFVKVLNETDDEAGSYDNDFNIYMEDTVGCLVTDMNKFSKPTRVNLDKFNVSEIVSICRSLPNGKAPGVDCITCI